MDDGLRVIVGDETGGPRSALWRVWTARRASDVYLGARPIAGEVRVSLHESGRWRYAFTAKHQFGPKPLIGPDEDRRGSGGTGHPRCSPASRARS